MHKTLVKNLIKIDSSLRDRLLFLNSYKSNYIFLQNKNYIFIPIESLKSDFIINFRLILKQYDIKNYLIKTSFLFNYFLSKKFKFLFSGKYLLIPLNHNNINNFLFLSFFFSMLNNLKLEKLFTLFKCDNSFYVIKSDKELINTLNLDYIFNISNIKNNLLSLSVFNYLFILKILYFLSILNLKIKLCQVINN